MGKTCPTPSLNSSISNSVITNVSSSSHNQSHSNSHHHQHQHQHQHQHHHHHQQQQHHSVPLPPPPPPQSIQPQQQHFPQKYMNSKRKHANNYHNMLMHPGAHLDHNNYLHLNSLWSIWYGVLLTLFQGYLAVHGAYRFLGCSLISWKIEPVAELNLQIVLSGVVFILLPFFFTSAVFKVGNLANDGIKLATGSKERRCSMSPHDGLEEEARGGTLRALWTHGGPTAAFVHIVIAMCLLLPRLLLEARIIENGLLPRENIWQTELDFIAVNRRNLVVLSVVTAPYQNGTGNNGDASNSLDDDQEEDYYNDTMFTAVGSGTTGTNINNNELDILSDSIRGKMATNVGKRIGEGKRKSSNNVGVDFSDGGKTRYFEVPGLINRDSNEEPGDFDEVNNKEEEEDDDDGVSDVVNHKNNNKYEFKEEADIYDGRGAKGGDDDGDGGGVSGVGVGEGRIFVEHFDAKEFWENRPANIPQSTTTKAITTSTIKAATESTDNNNKNYDKMWDKLGTLGKANSFADGMLDADVENAAATTTTNKLSSTTTSNIRQQPETTTTTTASELDRSTGNEAVVTTTITSATATKITTAMGNKHTNKMAQNTSTLKTTTTSDSSNYNNNYTDKAKKGVLVAASFTTTTFTPAAHTQPTRTHNHHQHHNHQHHKEQPQSPQQAHTHATHSSKSTRKHHTQNRQHHRQRGGQHHNRRHQNNSGGAATGGRSDESAPSRGSRLDTGRAAADLRTPTAFDLNKVTGTGINLNRLDELDLSAGTTFEQSIITPRGQNRDSAASFDTDARDYDARRIYTKSTSTTSTTTRDSNIHIVKPEKLPEIIPSTPLTSNSKIIEIKTKSSIGNGGGLKRNKRMAEAEMQVEIEPEYLVGELSGNDSSEYLGTSSSADSAVSASSSSSSATANTVSTARQPPQTSLARLDGFAGMLQIFFGIEKPIDMGVFEHPPSAEFVNLLFALLVWCVRYPAVFWTTTKSFATIFSIQMIAVAFDIIFSYIGAANLYKLQVYSEAMPIQTPGLILNGVVTLALFLLSSALMISSSMIMYLYGHGRLAAKMRDRSLITMKSSETWIYFAHCASLCYVLACAVVKAPLLNDLSATYKNNLHCPTFLSAVISVAHILLWIVIWLCLTAKHRWTFKLPPMDAYGITKATTQPLLMANRSSLPSAGSVSGSGSNIGSSDQKASSLMSGGGGSGGGSGRGGKLSTESSTDGGTDDVYWPKLTPSSPKLKVTFNEVPSTSDDVLLIGDHEQNDGKRHSPRGTALCFASVAGEIDDGEYATLRTASAATMAGINMTSMSSRVVAKDNIIDPVMTIGCGNETHVGSIPNNNSSTTPTGIYGMKLLHLSEYDELPPPPPQLMPIISGQNSSVARGDYVNCGGDKGGGSRGGGGSSATGTGSFGDDSTSEEGKLLACVHDDSVTYASTRDLEPPAATTPPPPPPTTTTTTTLIANDQQSSAAHTHNKAAGVNSLMHTGMMGSNGGDGVVANAGAAVAAAASMVGRAPQAIPENMQLSSSPEHLVSPLAPVTVTVHTNEAHIASSSTPRCLRRADSGVPNEALTPRSDTTSTTESTTSPPERAPSESSSGVHSGEERDVEVVIRPRAACKPPPKPPQPAIQEEPYGRCTNMRMSSFGGDTANPGASGGGGGRALNSATLPLTRSAPEQKFDYANHCSTMPLPAACHSQQQAAVAARGSGNYGMTTSAYSMHSQPPLPPPPLNSNLSSFRSQYANSAVAMAGAKAAQMLQQQQHEQQQQQYSQPQSTSPPPPPPPAGMHTTLPNGVRYSNPHFLRRLPHVTKAAESPYGHLGLGAGHHTFSKLLQDPLQHSLVNTAIPEDRDSANYSMSSEPDCGNLYATAQTYN